MTSHIWIGGSDERVEGNWSYSSSGLPLTYFHWNGGEPNGGTTENCIWSHSNGYWIDVSCYYLSVTICEKVLVHWLHKQMVEMVM